MLQRYKKNSDSAKLFRTFFCRNQLKLPNYPLTQLPTYDRSILAAFPERLAIKHYYYIYYNIYNNKTILYLNCTYNHSHPNHPPHPLHLPTKTLNFVRAFPRHGIVRTSSTLLMAYGKPSCHNWVSGYLGKLNRIILKFSYFQILCKKFCPSVFFEYFCKSNRLHKIYVHI